MPLKSRVIPPSIPITPRPRQSSRVRADAPAFSTDAPAFSTDAPAFSTDAPAFSTDAPAFTRWECHHHPTHPPRSYSAAESMGRLPTAAFRGRHETGDASCRRDPPRGGCGLGARRCESLSWTRPRSRVHDPYSQGTPQSAAPLGCGVQPLRGKELGSQSDLAVLWNRLRNCNRLKHNRPFTFPGRRNAAAKPVLSLPPRRFRCTAVCVSMIIIPARTPFRNGGIRGDAYNPIEVSCHHIESFSDWFVAISSSRFSNRLTNLTSPPTECSFSRLRCEPTVLHEHIIAPTHGRCSPSAPVGSTDCQRRHAQG